MKVAYALLLMTFSLLFGRGEAETANPPTVRANPTTGSQEQAISQPGGNALPAVRKPNVRLFESPWDALAHAPTGGKMQLPRSIFNPDSPAWEPPPGTGKKIGACVTPAGTCSTKVADGLACTCWDIAGNSYDGTAQ
jgi:hypothetical protein